ncbi:hypothetical protein KBTX_04509 [wastewater metagenome]|uniref:Uncharacterized protein n=2 Tax=unclassified sequences TaxID=12908 RepID=A0A5B8RK37_9ZZZZ|nr:hypothetical protein KBTEX_04509 [uncultured organism]
MTRLTNFREKFKPSPLKFVKLNMKVPHTSKRHRERRPSSTKDTYQTPKH